MNPPPVAIRCPSGKRRYLDQHTAEKDMRKIRAADPTANVARAYLCECGTWHLTKHAEWKPPASLAQKRTAKRAINRLFQTHTP